STEPAIEIAGELYRVVHGRRWRALLQRSRRSRSPERSSEPASATSSRALQRSRRSRSPERADDDPDAIVIDVASTEPAIEIAGESVDRLGSDRSRVAASTEPAIEIAGE